MKRNALSAVAVAVVGVVIIAVAVAVFKLGGTNADFAFSLKDTVLYLGVGQSYQIPIEGEKKPGFKSYDKKIAQVDENGVISAVKLGDTIIKVGSKKLELHVVEPPKEIEISEKKLTLGVGEKFSLSAKSDDKTVSSEITYSVSDKKILNIDSNGLITANAAGKATVTAETYNGLQAKCEVAVMKAPEKMTLSAFNSKLYVGTSFDLKADFGKNSAARGIEFKTDNADVLSVDKKGRAKAIAVGTATVTATAYNGVSAQCVFDVSEKPYYIRTDLDPSKPMAAFTFDDGPNAPTTSGILKTLEKNGCSATFFIVGSRTKNSNHAECVKEMVKNGFEIGNHTYDHKHYGSDVTSQDISKCSDILYEVSGRRPTAFRPTGGYLTDKIKSSCGTPLILWNVDTEDWRSKNASSVYAALKKDIKNGGIILMHDIYKSTADAVEKAVPELVKNGWQIVNVSELAYYKGKELQNGKTYYSF